MLVHLIVLNYNGRHLLPECLPSILDAAAASRYRCRVTVIDNASRDDSVSWLRDSYPEVSVIEHLNRGLCSYNDVLPELTHDGDVAILLNNDIKLHPGAVDPLVEPFLCNASRTVDSKCFMTAPRCRRFDDETYEGFRTAIRWRWGLVQATALYPGHEANIGIPGQTASAGAVMAVDCRKFISLGGFDPLYLPGRLEDLDFAFRGYQTGYHALYVPHSLAWHKGMASFAAAFGEDGCDWLALRNTLLFQWKNLRHPAHIVQQVFGAVLRLAADFVRAPWLPPARRFAFMRAFVAAWKRKRASILDSRPRRLQESHFASLRRERDYFRRFHPKSDFSAALDNSPAVDSAKNPKNIFAGHDGANVDNSLEVGAW